MYVSREMVHLSRREVDLTALPPTFPVAGISAALLTVRDALDRREEIVSNPHATPYHQALASSELKKTLRGLAFCLEREAAGRLSIDAQLDLE